MLHYRLKIYISRYKMTQDYLENLVEVGNSEECEHYDLVSWLWCQQLVI